MAHPATTERHGRGVRRSPGWPAPAAVCLAAAAALGAEQPAAEHVRLKPEAGEWLAVEPSSDLPGEPSAAVRAHLMRKYPRLMPASPGFAALLEGLAAATVDGRVACDVYNDLARRFNACQDLAEAVDRSTVPDDLKHVLRAHYLRAAFDPKGKLNVAEEKRFLEKPEASARLVRLGRKQTDEQRDEPRRPTPAGLVKAIEKACPDFGRLRPMARKLAVDYVASINPVVKPAGSYRLLRGRKNQEKWDHVAVPIGGGDERVWLYRVEPGSLVYIPDAETLRRVGNPDVLDLRHSWVSDLYALEALSFVTLDISRSPMKNLEPLRYHPGLKRLKAEGLAADDLQPLENLPLESLDISDGTVANVAALRKMHLRKLDISRTEVADLSPLRHMPLEELDISFTKVKDLSPLAGMPLRRLVLAGTEVTDLSPLAAAVQGRPSRLAELVIARTPITDLRPLSRLPLVRLDASGSKVTDVSPLASTPLEELDLSHTDFRDLASLHKLHVKRLNLAWTKITDASGLAGLKLDLLELTGSGVRKLAPLLKVPVRHLILCRWSIVYDDVDVLSQHPTLKTMGSLSHERMAIDNWMKRHKRYGPKSRTPSGPVCAPPKAGPTCTPPK